MWRTHSLARRRSLLAVDPCSPGNECDMVHLATIQCYTLRFTFDVCIIHTQYLQLHNAARPQKGGRSTQPVAPSFAGDAALPGSPARAHTRYTPNPARYASVVVFITHLSLTPAPRLSNETPGYLQACLLSCRGERHFIPSVRFYIPPQPRTR